MNEEDEYSKLRNELNKSQRRLKVIGIVSGTLIGILLLGWVTSYLVLSFELSLVRRHGEMSKFAFYYAGQCEQRYGVDDLESYLDRWQWIEGTYVEGKFDCSEMSAYIEWRLENEGFHTVIVVGQSPSNPEAGHAWLLVETSSGEYMPVEATQYALVKWDNPYFDQYFSYDHSFETILEALGYDYEGFNWWES